MKMKKILALLLVLAVAAALPSAGFAEEDLYTGKHIIILRLDDLRSDTTGAFEWALNTALEKEVKVAFGVIGNSLEDGACNRRFIDFMKHTDSVGMEIWSHGYVHKNTEYNGSSYDEQLKNFKRTYDLMQEKCNIELHTFGPPYNVADDTGIRMITENFPSIKVFMSVKDSNKIAKQMKLNDRIIIESTTGTIDYDKFETSYKQAVSRNYECSVILGHPSMWNEASKQYFIDIIDFLKNEGCVFMTPYQYYCYKNNTELPEKTADNFKNYNYIMLDGSFIDFVTYPETEGESQRVFAPVKEFFEALGMTVRYNPEEKGYTIYKGDSIVQISEKSEKLYYNGDLVKMPAPPKVIGGRLMADVYFFADFFDMKPYIDKERKIVYIYSSERDDESLYIAGSSSSYYHNYSHGGFSYDGKKETLWETNGSGRSDAKKWIVYDLGSLCNVSEVGIQWGGAGSDFEISVSEDNLNWRDAFTGKKTSGAVSENFTLDGASGVQYVKFTSLSANKTNISEIYIRGTRQTALPPKQQPETDGTAEPFADIPNVTSFEFSQEDIYENMDTVLSAPLLTVDGENVTKSVQKGSFSLPSGKKLVAHYGDDAELEFDVQSVEIEETKLYDSFKLPAVLNYGSTVKWESSDTRYITIENNTAVVCHYDTDNEDVNVTLTATVSKNGKSKTKEFYVTVGLREEFSVAVSEDACVRTGKSSVYGSSAYLRAGGQKTPLSTGSYQPVMRFDCAEIKNKIALADYIAVRLNVRSSDAATVNIYGIEPHGSWSEATVNAVDNPDLVKYTDNFLGEYVTLGMSKEVLEIDITDYAKKQADGIIELKLSVTTPGTETFSFFAKENGEQTMPTLVGYSNRKGALYSELKEIKIGDMTAVQKNIYLPTAAKNGDLIDWKLDMNAGGAAYLNEDNVLEISAVTDNENAARAMITASITNGADTAAKSFNIIIKNGILPENIYFVSDNKILSDFSETNIGAAVKTSNISGDNAFCIAFYEDNKLVDIKTTSEYTQESGSAVYTIKSGATENATKMKAFLLNKKTLQPIVLSEELEKISD